MGRLGDTVDASELTAEHQVLAVAGDRANNPTKRITLETGMEIQAPMFINAGDTVKVNLEEGSYVTRVNN